LGIEELAKAKKETISQAFLLTDGENEHGDNNRCLKFAEHNWLQPDAKHAGIWGSLEPGYFGTNC